MTKGFDRVFFAKKKAVFYNHTTSGPRLDPIAGVVILSVVISFAYTCQYSYFELTPESAAYGEGRAMGVYSVFESLGQTIGPIAYGVLLTLGYRSGIMVFCLVMFAMLLAFVAITYRSAKEYREN